MSLSMPTVFKVPEARTPQDIEDVAVHYSTFYDEDGALVGEWRWKYFSPRELACKTTGLLWMDEDTLDRAEAFREAFGAPVTCRSGYRSVRHNNKIRHAARNSYHLYGEALDLDVTGSCRDLSDVMRMRRILRRVGFTAVVDYPGHMGGFIHVDARRAGSRSWNGFDVGGDQGFAGDAWSASFVDPDGRLERSARSTEERVKDAVVAGGAVTGTAVLDELAAGGAETGWFAAFGENAKYAIAVTAAAVALYVLIKHRREVLAWVRSLFWGR